VPKTLLVDHTMLLCNLQLMEVIADCVRGQIRFTWIDLICYLFRGHTGTADTPVEPQVVHVTDKNVRLFSSIISA